jgi:4-alpha-glucanotransferase
MRVVFNINFPTIWGQSLRVTGSSPELGEWDKTKAPEMQCISDGQWRLELDLDLPADDFEDETEMFLMYRYMLYSDGRPILEEWNKNHHTQLMIKIPEHIIYDNWLSVPSDAVYYTAPFTNSLMFREEEAPSQDKHLHLYVIAPRVERDQIIAISGSSDYLGQWDTSKAIPLRSNGNPYWVADLDASAMTYPCEYKFIVINDNTYELEYWESGANRSLDLPPITEGQDISVTGLVLQTELPPLKAAGVSVPLF